MRVRAFIASLSCVAMLAGCGSDGGDPTPTPVPATATPLRSITASPTAPAASPTPTITANPTDPPPATRTATAATVSVASTIQFAPAVLAIDNPAAPGMTTPPSQVSIELSVYDANGDPVTPSAEAPITVSVHGAPAGAISPTSLTLTDGTTATFDYSGAYVPNAITVTASMPIAGGQALGVTQILQANAIACDYGTTSYTVPIICVAGSTPSECAAANIAQPLQVRATVGHSTPGAADLHPYTIDTGSLGVVVPAAELGDDAVGPGANGKILYDSSGNTYLGRYYLAPVSIALADGTYVQTDPVKVLAITSAYCAPGYRCDPNKPVSPDLRYLGIGFDRERLNAGDQFNLPADNAALHIATAANGTDVSPGYVITGSSLTLGIVSTEGYALTALTPSSVPGDWNTMPGCFSFPELAEPNQFCGSLLFDVGIVEMFLQLPPRERPDGSNVDGQVPLGVTMDILAGTPEAASMSYRYTLSQDPGPRSPQPSSVNWRDTTGVFVNTGRHPLYAFDYLFDARCGNVGFRPIAP